jgi:hypothetical protein
VLLIDRFEGTNKLQSSTSEPIELRADSIIATTIRKYKRKETFNFFFSIFSSITHSPIARTEYEILQLYSLFFGVNPMLLQLDGRCSSESKCAIFHFENARERCSTESKCAIFRFENARESFKVSINFKKAKERFKNSFLFF